jgi:hypothetical protein
VEVAVLETNDEGEGAREVRWLIAAAAATLEVPQLSESRQRAIAASGRTRYMRRLRAMVGLQLLAAVAFLITGVAVIR